MVECLRFSISLSLIKSQAAHLKASYLEVIYSFAQKKMMENLGCG